jgi:hypothetical protein
MSQPQGRQEERDRALKRIVGSQFYLRGAYKIWEYKHRLRQQVDFVCRATYISPIICNFQLRSHVRSPALTLLTETQALSLLQSRDAWKTVPTRKKRAPPSAPSKATPAPPNTNARQNGSAHPPSSFRAPGGSSDHRELDLPGGRVIVNRADFNARPAAAKFFVIKSNSVDDVHKSIKYGVWASTSYGNKRLHAAYQEAQAAQPPCRVFLLFSVNASGQFCGVAEMVRAVPFDTRLFVRCLSCRELVTDAAACLPCSWSGPEDIL